MLGLLLPCRSTAQAHNFLNYNSNHGLASTSIQVIKQTKNGYLWLGTNGAGLYQFNGKSGFDFGNQHGLKSKSIYNIEIGENQTVWLATERGLVRYDGFEFIPIPNPYSTLAVSSIAIFDEENSVYCGTQKGVYIYNFNKEEWSEIKDRTLDQSNIFQCRKDHRKPSIFAATNKGLFEIKGGKVIGKTTDQDGLPSNLLSRSFRNNAQELLLQSPSQILTLDNDGSISTNSIFSDIPNSSAILQPSNNELWISSKNDGAYFINLKEGTKIHYRINQGLPDLQINTLFIDKDGNVWMGSQEGNLIKVIEQNFEFLNSSNGLPAKQVTALLENPNGELLIGSAESGIFKYSNGKFSPFRLDQGYLNQPVTQMLSDTQGKIWVSTAGKGIAILDSLGVYKIINSGNGLPEDWISNMSQDYTGNIYFTGNQFGLYKISSNALDTTSLNIQTISGTRQKRILYLKEQNGDIWYSTAFGSLHCISPDGSIKNYGAQARVPEGTIPSFTFSNKNRLWIAVNGKGLFYSSSNLSSSKTLSFKAYPYNDRLRSKHVNFIQESSSGDLWMGSDQGLVRIKFNKDGTPLLPSFFGRGQGFLGGKPNNNVVLQSENRKIFVGTRSGLVAINSNIQAAIISKPTIQFNQISLFYEPLQKTELKKILQKEQSSLSLTHRQNHLGFSLSGVQLSFPGALKYRWMLKGLDQEWSPWSERNEINYSNLPAGKYEFQAQAAINQDLPSEAISAYFEITAPIWKKLWFQILAGLLSLILIVGLFQSRIKTIREQSLQKNATLRMRNRVLELQQKSSQLQMNPHFIFNTLNSINGLIARNKNSEARKQITTFARQLRGMLNNSRKEFITIEEERRSLEDYLLMLQFCHTSKFSFDIQVASGIDQEEMELPPMLIQPFVENSILHGMHRSDDKGAIAINFELIGKLLQITVLDNGIGRQAAQQKKGKHGFSNTGPDHQSAGMEVTQSRLKNLKGIQHYNALEIIDLKEDNISKGTKVIIRMPYRLSY